MKIKTQPITNILTEKTIEQRPSLQKIKIKLEQILQNPNFSVLLEFTRSLDNNVALALSDMILKKLPETESIHNAMAAERLLDYTSVNFRYGGYFNPNTEIGNAKIRILAYFLCLTNQEENILNDYYS